MYDVTFGKIPIRIPICLSALTGTVSIPRHALSKLFLYPPNKTLLYETEIKIFLKTVRSLDYSLFITRG